MKMEEWIMAKKKLTRLDLLQMKEKKEILVWITAYDYWTAKFAEEAGDWR